MKSYTDIEQSKKLAEILPLESADMFWYGDAVTKEGNPRIMNYMQIPKLQSMYYSPCWSLAALLNFLESEIDGEEGETYQLNIEKDGTWWDVWYREQYDEAIPIETKSTKELIEACYELILKLHELNLL